MNGTYQVNDYSILEQGERDIAEVPNNCTIQSDGQELLFDFTAAGVVPCGGRKTSPRTSTIVQFIFYFGPLRSAIIF